MFCSLNRRTDDIRPDDDRYESSRVYMSHLNDKLRYYLIAFPRTRHILMCLSAFLRWVSFVSVVTLFTSLFYDELVLLLMLLLSCWCCCCCAQYTKRRQIPILVVHRYRQEERNATRLRIKQNNRGSWHTHGGGGGCCCYRRVVSPTRPTSAAGSAFIPWRVEYVPPILWSYDYGHA